MTEWRFSIIVVTRNRAQELKKTLESLDRLRWSSVWEVELLVIDNGSTDCTPQVVQDHQSRHLSLRYIREARAGKSAGLNRGVSEATGDVLVFTDDDVRVPEDWLERIAAPILRGESDAVVGAIRMATHLRRPWMTDLHRGALADCDPRDSKRVVLIGANMAVSRRMFEVVPSFDEEIGPGPGVGGEDTLFSWQLEFARFRISAAEICVEHHFHSSRLKRRSLLETARKGGYSDAYIFHHWEHGEIRFVMLRLLRARLRLLYYRLRYFPKWIRSEGCEGWEMQLTQDISFLKNYSKERVRNRNYLRHGLRRISDMVSPEIKPYPAE